MGLGDFAGGGLDDINGLGADGDLEILGLESLSGLGDYVGTWLGGTSLAVIDGLGRVRRVPVRRSRGRARGTTATASQATATAPAASQEQKLGLYVPLNTLRNLFKLRAASLDRLKAQGKTVSPGQVPTTVDGLALAGLSALQESEEDGLGWGFFKKIAQGVSQTVNQVVKVASPVANLVPGLAPVSSLVSAGNNLLQRIGQSPAPKPATAVAAAAPAPVAPSPATRQAYAQKHEQEAMSAYQQSLGEGLGSLPLVDKAVGFVKNNPLLTLAGAGAVGYGIYHFWPKGSKGRKKASKGSAKGLGRAPRKKSKKGKKRKAGSVQTFRYQSLR
jgi:hypothetical protein